MNLPRLATIRLLVLAFVVVALVMPVAPGGAAAALADQLMLSERLAQLYVPGEVLVKFKPAATAMLQQQSIRSMGAQQIGTLALPGWSHLKLPTGVAVEQALATFRSDPNVESAQPNFIYHIAAAPDDTDYGQQWALKNNGQEVGSSLLQSGDSLYVTNNPGTPGDDLDMELAWDHITDCSPVTIAIVDSGVNYNQTDLAGNMWDGGATYPKHGTDFVIGDNDPMDRNGHGTHLAGIIGAAGNDNFGTTGICWKANIMAVRVLDATGTGTTQSIAKGVTFAVEHGARVINLSLGGPNFDQVFSDAVTNAQANGVVVVAAAGNEGVNNDAALPTMPTYPCNFGQSNLICVAALDQSYQLAAFSNYGSTSVDVGAPGTNIVNTWAGTNTMMTDDFSKNWTSSSTTAGGWITKNLSVSGVLTPVLVDPSTYPSGAYNNNTDDRIYKTFSVPAASVVVLESFYGIDVANGDHFRVNYSATPGDPFGGSSTNVIDVTNAATFPSLYLLPVDITGCASSNCSIGAQLQSDNDGTVGRGVAITGFKIRTLTIDNSSYNTISGTSMATPHVAALAAMLMAYNPNDTYTDVVSAIKNGGRAVTALAGKTTTGKAVDAMGSLAYINPPTGLSANVQ